MYFKIPTYKKDFEPSPKLKWEKTSDDTFYCSVGRATLRVFRFGENSPWWAECENPQFESATWFYTPEQAQHWLEEQIRDWFANTTAKRI